jgi:putative salt-induced outer membrane protein YdiY
MNLQKILSTFAAILVLAYSSLAQSDQITLNNGDTLQGILVAQSDTFVTWKSDNFGIFKIPKLKIASIEYSDSNPSGITEAPAKDKIIYSGSVGISGAYLSGNENRNDLELDILLTHEQGNLTHNTEVNYETLGQENESNIKDYGITYGIDWAIDDSWYWGNKIFYGADDKRLIDQSVSVETSLGYLFWKNDNGQLSTEIGLAWINDKLFSTINDKRLALVWSGDYQKQLNSKVSLSYSHQLNVSMKDSENTQLSADIGFIIPVTDKLDTKISWDLAIDNLPVQGNEKIDRKLKFGADYSF